MSLLAMLSLQRRRNRIKEDKPLGVTEPEPETQRIGNTRRKKKHSACKHDPMSRAIADFIVTSYHSLTKPLVTSDLYGNGLENTPWSRLCSSNRALWLFLLAFRITNCFFVQTSYVPDEYWQSMEVSHKAAFGYGYLTWEWREQIRSFLYPSIFAFAYKVIEFIGMDTRAVIILVPRLMQSVLAAVGDVYLYQLSRRLAGEAVAQCALLCQLLSWYTFYTCTRTLTNSAEAVLTTVALHYYPFKMKESSQKDAWKFLWIAAIACLVRPTAAVLWAPLCLCHLWACLHSQKRNIVIVYLSTAAFFLLLSLRIDKSLYGLWVFTPYKFFEFNVLCNLSGFYGSHPWHWYCTQGLPVILGPHFVIFVFSLLRAKHRVLQLLVAYTVLVYSLLPHKEFRFIVSVLPLTMHLCGYWIVTYHQSAVAVRDQHDGDNSGSEEPTMERPQLAATQPLTSAAGEERATPSLDDAGSRAVKPAVDRRTRPRALWRPTTRQLFALLAVLNIPLTVYFSLMHQRGSLDVMKHLHVEIQRYEQHHMAVNMSVLFLMPCHSTPFYSHVHANISMRFLTCEPPLPRNKSKHAVNNSAASTDFDEADEFYARPLKWLKKNVLQGPPGSVPTHLVMYDALEPEVGSFVDKGKYIASARFFHTHFPDGRVGREIVVFRRDAVASSTGPTADLPEAVILPSLTS